MQRIYFLVLAGFLSAATACSPKYSRSVQYDQALDTATSLAPNYSEINSWAAHPWKKDLSDSLPAIYKKNYKIDSTVDVFFIHPTTLTADKSVEWNANFADASLNTKTDYGSILYQASAFNEYRVFAPRYRQAHVRSYYTADTLRAKKAFDTAYADIKASFQYYLDHYNNGRPFILASHSQGTTHALRLLNEFFVGNYLKNRLVAAYLTGMYLPPENASGITICKDSVQTGCICGWRTFQKGYEPEYVKEEKSSSLITNPLTWTASTAYAPASLNSGSVLKNFDKRYVHLVDAQIRDGVLWISKPRFPGSFLLKMKNYHIADINMFYGNIRENIHTRVSAFWKR